MKSIVKNINHYLPLFGIFAATLIGIVVFSSDRGFQEVIVIAVSASYVAWGVVHHLAHKDLTAAIILEYFAVAFFGVVIVFSLLLRA